jgi:nucleotide-binding universal stress UspA family protein
VTFVAGYAPDARDAAVLQLAAMLARSAGDDLVVTVVVPRSWFPSMARVDAEYRASLDELVTAALARARSQLPDDVPATFVQHEAGSVPAGLTEVADQHGAGLVVLGSSSAGLFGHVTVSSVTDHLLHSSTLPVALAPRGLRAKAGARVGRFTVAYGRSEDADALALAAASLAARAGASLRLATFAVWSRPAYTMRLGADGEDAVLSEWVTDSRDAARSVLATVRAQPGVPDDCESVVGVGESWSAAVDDVEWRDDDVLLVGSSRTGPVARVFLGSRATKLVRQSPVPVIVVPRPTSLEPG